MTIWWCWEETRADGRIPLSDGAGEVIAVGDDVEAFEVGDAVVSTYWPDWLGGEPTPASKRGELGDDIDGYSREYVCMPSHAFTKAPPGYTHLEGAACSPAKGSPPGEVWWYAAR